MMQRRNSFRCRRRADHGGGRLLAGLAALAVAAPGAGCGDSHRASEDADSGVASEADAGAVADDPAALLRSRYYDGYFAETLRGDLPEARAAYEEVIAEAGSTEPELAARAALRLADLEMLAGNRREAVELVARASVLGRTNAAIVERADRMQTFLASLRSKGSEVRGPPAGTKLNGVEPALAEEFAKAEQLLAAYHTIELRPRLEGLRAAIRAKEHAMDLAERAYRQVIADGPPQAVLAAEFRIASLQHDLALSLMFDLPPELEAAEAAKLRRSLRGRAITYLRRASTGYRHSLDAAEQLQADAATERWRVAAERGLRSVDDLLRGRDQGP